MLSRLKPVDELANNVKQALVSRFSDDTVYSSKSSSRSYHPLNPNKAVHDPMPSLNPDMLVVGKDLGKGATVVRTVEEALQYAYSHSRTGSSTSATQDKDLPARPAVTPVLEQRGPSPSRPNKQSPRPQHVAPTHRPVHSPPLQLTKRTSPRSSSSAAASSESGRGSPSCSCHLLHQRSQPPFEARSATQTDQDSALIELNVGGKTWLTSIRTLSSDGLLGKLSTYVEQLEQARDASVESHRHLHDEPDEDDAEEAQVVVRSMIHPPSSMSSYQASPFLLTKYAFTNNSSSSQSDLASLRPTSHLDASDYEDDYEVASPIDPIFVPAAPSTKETMIKDGSKLFVPPSRHKLFLAAVQANTRSIEHERATHLVPSPTSSNTNERHVSSKASVVSFAIAQDMPQMAQQQQQQQFVVEVDLPVSPSVFVRSPAEAQVFETSAEQTQSSSPSSALRQEAAAAAVLRPPSLTFSHSSSSSSAMFKQGQRRTRNSRNSASTRPKPHIVFLDRDSRPYEDILAFARNNGRLPVSIDYTCSAPANKFSSAFCHKPDQDHTERLLALREEAEWLGASMLVAACEASLHHLVAKLNQMPSQNKLKHGWI